MNCQTKYATANHLNNQTKYYNDIQISGKTTVFFLCI